MGKIILFICNIFICVASFAQPTITTFSPVSDTIGSSVTITGTGFNTTGNQNIVFFGATQSTVTAASATSLTVTVPLGTTYQYISVTNLATNLTAYSAQPFIATFAGNILFAVKLDLAAGVNARSVSMGDIDGDGKPDLAVANQGSNSISVFRNTSVSGTVTFATKVDFTTGTNPFSVSIGDINGDGKPDLVVTNNGSNTVSVFRSISTPGTISFAAKVDFTTGTEPYSVSIGDIDIDGKPDLAVTNLISNTVSVLRNTSTLGTISFAAKVDFSTGAGTEPSTASIGDLDGDGKPDLVVGNSNTTIVSVFRNTSILGTINFAAKVDFTAGSDPISVSIGDIDNDSKPDLVVANRMSNNVSVFRNTSTSGTVSFATKVDFATGSTPRSVSIGDIDGDGKIDLATANQGSSSTISVLRSTSTSGTISFAAKVDFATAIWSLSVSLGDIDGDGKPDLVAANYNSNTVSVLRQIVSAVGIIETSNSNSFSIYPNPFSAQTTLVTSNFLNNATFVVYNSFGQQVKQMQNISGQTITFQRDDLPSGLYFIRLMQDNNVIAIKKLIIAD